MYRGAARPTTNTATMKRIQHEIRDVAKEDLGDITLVPSETSIFNWTASIPGPEGSVYEGGVFKLSIKLPPDYPFSSPQVQFDTRIYHMNISPSGAICLDVLKSQWSPALSLFKVMLSISSLLTDPNPQDPLVPAIAAEYTRSRATHDATAREWTRLYALSPKPTNAATQAKGKGKAPATTATTTLQPPTASAGSNPSSARATPTASSVGSRRPRTAAGASTPEVIELSSDVEEDTSRGSGRNPTPIMIDDDDDPAEEAPPPPTLALPQTSKARASNGKRKRSGDDPQGGEASGSTTGTATGPGAGGSSTGRVTRSSKRRAAETSTGETIVID